jgi:FKBP12-rapamycin complex-associated protein
VLFPLAFAFLVSLPDGAFWEVFKAVIRSGQEEPREIDMKQPPAVTRQFLAIADVLEMTGSRDFVRRLYDVGDTKFCRDLARIADLVGEYTQALRYYEHLYRVHPSPEIAKKLAVFYQRVGCRDSMNKVIKMSIKISGQNLITFCEDIGEWQAALDEYETDCPGKYRCLEALNMFHELAKLTQGQKSYFAASSQWSLGNLPEFQRIVESMNDDPGADARTQLKSQFFRAIVQYQEKKFDEIPKLIQSIRKGLEKLLLPTISQDYERALPDLCFASEVCVFEEIVSDEFSIENWRSKFGELSDRPSEMFSMLNLISLKLNGCPDLEEFYKQFIRHCSSIELRDLVAGKLSPDHPEVQFLRLRKEFKKTMKEFGAGLRDLAKEKEFVGRQTHLLNQVPPGSDYERIIALWNFEASLHRESREQRAFLLETARKHLQAFSETSTEWIFVNFRIFEEDHSKVNELQTSLKAALKQLDSQRIASHVLRVLFEFGDVGDCQTIFVESLTTLQTKHWLFFLPQIVARFGTENQNLQRAISKLISATGLDHPDAVLYSLLAPKESLDRIRRTFAISVLQTISNRFPQLVNVAEGFALNLTNLASTWWEIWFQALRETWDDASLVSQFMPCHELLRQPANSFYEISFVAQWADRLGRAEELLRQFADTKDPAYSKAVEAIYRELGDWAAQMHDSTRHLRLQLASPFLYELRNSLLTVPGSYLPDCPLVRIEFINPEVEVMYSKQRPRKIQLTGTNGRRYNFLLKSREDVRRDERIMQFFQFVSLHIPEGSRLSLTTYPVVPLNNQTGLMGWLERCETLNSVVMQLRRLWGHHGEMATFNQYYPPDGGYYRQPRTPNEEQDLAEAFNKAAAAGPGRYLSTMLVMASADSGDWLEKRGNYTASLAITSFVGYVIGLGDRHLSNIMIHTETGRLVHIDFGDAFEVAQTRKDWPERVPFRMTRMLVEPLDVTGVEGAVRGLSGQVLKVLRRLKSEILGLLDTFVQDPLKNEEGVARKRLERVKLKLEGKAEENAGELGWTVRAQVKLLLREATDHFNLMRMFPGWQAFI